MGGVGRRGGRARTGHARDRRGSAAGGRGRHVARQCRIDREPVPSASAFADHLRVVWLVPAMDGLFNGPASERRRFLDRLVLAVDAEHMSRVNALERALRSRNRLLEDPRPDPHWLDAVEHETAELAVAVTALRVETVDRLKGALAARKDAGFGVSRRSDRARRLDGTSSCRFTLPSRWRIVTVRRCASNRARDAAAGRTLDGPHLTDLAVVHAGKGIAAAQASTGEQKALLIGLVLAHAGLLAEMSGFAPVLLLDEVVAHLDPSRRAALYGELQELGVQAWMTGADAAAFVEIEGTADMLEVSPGQIGKRKRGS